MAYKKSETYRSAMYRPRNVKRDAKRGVSIRLRMNFGPFIATRSIRRERRELRVPIKALRYIGFA